MLNPTQIQQKKPVAVDRPSKTIANVAPQIMARLRRVTNQLRSIVPRDSSARHLNRILIPVLKELGEVTSINVAKLNGKDHYMLLQQAESFVSRGAAHDGSPAYQKWQSPMHGQRTAGLHLRRHYDPTQTVWMKTAQKMLHDGVSIAGPYPARTTGDSIYTLVMRATSSRNEPLAIGFDVKLSDLNS